MGFALADPRAFGAVGVVGVEGVEPKEGVVGEFAVEGEDDILCRLWWTG